MQVQRPVHCCCFTSAALQFAADIIILITHLCVDDPGVLFANVRVPVYPVRPLIGHPASFTTIPVPGTVIGTGYSIAVIMDYWRGQLIYPYSINQLQPFNYDSLEIMG